MKELRKVEVIPALSGWLLIEPTHDGKSIVGMVETTIVGWTVEIVRENEDEDPATYVISIIADGGTLCSLYPIQEPSGKIYIPHDRWFESQTELLEYWRNDCKDPPAVAPAKPGRPN